ncbi:MAG: helix-turn-helix domain-containing protein, partial [Myxococcota bacterium]
RLGVEAGSGLPSTLGADGQPMSLREYREFAERQYILDTLEAMEWNVSQAALRLGVERTNLHKKMRGYGIQRG